MPVDASRSQKAPGTAVTEGCELGENQTLVL